MVSDFFFQAEDGIRDTSVTGVQTCALPICLLTVVSFNDCRPGFHLNTEKAEREYQNNRGFRSEERRVGKECRSRSSRSASKKKRSEACNVWSGSSPTRQQWACLQHPSTHTR